MDACFPNKSSSFALQYFELIKTLYGTISDATLLVNHEIKERENIFTNNEEVNTATKTVNYSPITIYLEKIFLNLEKNGWVDDENNLEKSLNTFLKALMKEIEINEIEVDDIEL